MTALTSGLVVVAILLLIRPGRSRPTVSDRAPRRPPWRPLAAGLTVLVCWVVLGGWVGLLVGAAAAVGVDRVVRGRESRAVRRRAERLRADLPLALELLSAVVSAGAAVETALAEVADSVPGPVADEFAAMARRLRLGVAGEQVYAEVAADRTLAPLGRALRRAHTSGAAVGPSLDQAAEELRAVAATEVEVRARTVSTKAAAPLGLCLLPAFVLVGIVPMVAGLVSGLHLLGP